MKKKSFLGLLLIGASTFISATYKLNIKPVQGEPDNGICRLSSNGRDATVTEGVGNRSWTRTGPAGDEQDGLSATSRNDDGTDTHDAGNYTGQLTTATADEWN